MRDLVIVGMVCLAALVALRRPWIGIMCWTWVSLMNPHRYAYGFAVDAPVAMIAAASTLVGLMITKDRRDNPFKGSPTIWLAALMVWMTLSWRLGLDPRDDYAQWDKVMKIDFMVLVSLALLHSKKHIFALAWVCALSLGILGAKGGVFTIATGGSYRVWGPPASFVEDNNHFATALVMTIPLLRFLQLQLVGKWARRGMGVMMLLVAASAIGSHSRGALLAITAMAVFMWLKGRNRLVGLVVMAVVGVALITFMPDHWGERMETMRTYSEDGSAMGRISSWWVAWRLAFDYPFGVGFNAARAELFQMYSPYPEFGVFVAHSIYFQMLGHHGFVGLFIFLGIFISTFLMCRRIRKASEGHPQAQWCHDLAGMCQVSLIGYAIGGAFLQLGYFDLPYNIMVLVVLTHVWVTSRAWETEREVPSRWFRIPGVRSEAPAT